MKKILIKNQNRFLSSVVSEKSFDRKFFKRFKNLTYFSYQGATKSLSNEMDIRNSMVFGLLEDKKFSMIHIPQYQKLFWLPSKKANEIKIKSRPFTDNYYSEV